MFQIGALKYYTGEEAAALSGLDPDTISFCAAGRAVKPILHRKQLLFSENDVLVLKLIRTLIICKRSLRVAERLRSHFGLTVQSAERREANAIARLVDQMIQRD